MPRMPAHAGLPLAEVFNGTVYLVPPLRLGYQEAEQVVWFADRGLRVNIGGGMAPGGATAPITLAGMVTLTIAGAPSCSGSYTGRSTATAPGTSGWPRRCWTHARPSGLMAGRTRPWRI